MAIEIRVPTLGESISEATVGKWFKKAGEPVRADEPLVELETDKVTLEVNAPGAGVLSEISAETGQTVAIGALLGQLSGAAARAAASLSAKGDACARHYFSVLCSQGAFVCDRDAPSAFSREDCLGSQNRSCEHRGKRQTRAGA